MDSELTNKKNIRSWILVALVLLLGVFFLWQHNFTKRNYPFHVASIWQCDNPYFVIMYTREDNGILTSYEELQWNNKTLQVEICFLMSDYDVYPVTSSAYEDRLFSGTWEYRDGDFVLIIKEDFLFDNKYSELVFSPLVQSK